MATHTNPFKQLCLDSITAHRATLDNMEQVVKSLPDNWQGDTSSSSAGGGRGITTPKRPAARRNRAGGGRGGARGLGNQARNLGGPATNR